MTPGGFPCGASSAEFSRPSIAYASSEAITLYVCLVASLEDVRLFETAYIFAIHSGLTVFCLDGIDTRKSCDVDMCNRDACSHRPTEEDSKPPN